MKVKQSKGPSKNYDSFQWLQHQQKILSLHQYRTYGSLTYVSKLHKVHARFSWQQINQDCYRLLITNPFGSIKLDINTQLGIVQLINNRGQRYLYHSPEETMAKLTGISIPLNKIHQWIIGLPGDVINYTLDNQYRLNEINYSENNKIWRVIYCNYDSKTKPPLPLNIEIIQEGDQRIKLKMDNWIVK